MTFTPRYDFCLGITDVHVGPGPTTRQLSADTFSVKGTGSTFTFNVLSGAVDTVGASWITPAGIGPLALAQWPTGAYQALLNAVTIQAGISFKLRIDRCDQFGAVLETLGTSGAFTTTGAHSYTTGSITPVAGSDTDRLCLTLLVSNSTGGTLAPEFGAPSRLPCYVSAPILVPFSTFKGLGVNCAFGPVLVGSTLYAIAFDSGRNIAIWKATYPLAGDASTWTQTDVYQPSDAYWSTTQGIGCEVAGTTIKLTVLFQDGTPLAGETTIGVSHLFYMEINAGVITLVEDGVTLPAQNVVGGMAAIVNIQPYIAPRSAEQVVSYTAASVIDGGIQTQFKVMETRRTAPGTWTTPVQVNTTANQMIFGMTVGASDRVHFLYGPQLSSLLPFFHRSLDSGNSFDTEQTMSATFTNNGQQGVSYPIIDSGTCYMLLSTTVSATSRAKLLTFPDTANPSPTLGGAVFSVATRGVSLERISGTLHAFGFTDVDDVDIYHATNSGSGWVGEEIFTTPVGMVWGPTRLPLLWSKPGIPGTTIGFLLSGQDSSHDDLYYFDTAPAVVPNTAIVFKCGAVNGIAHVKDFIVTLPNLTATTVDSLRTLSAGGTYEFWGTITQDDGSTYDLNGKTITGTIRQLRAPNSSLGMAYDGFTVTPGNPDHIAAVGGVSFSVTLTAADFPTQTDVMAAEPYFVRYTVVDDNFIPQLLIFGVSAAIS